MTTAVHDASVSGKTHEFAHWQELVCRTYVPVRCNPLADRPFTAHLTTRELGSSQLSQIESSAVRYSRAADDIRTDSRDDLQFCLITEGELNITQSNRQAHLGPGDMGLYDASCPFDLEFPTHYQAIIVKLPRSSLASRLASPEQLTARQLAGDVRLGAMASSMLRHAAVLEGTGSDSISQRLSSSLADILALALEAELMGSAPLTNRHTQLLQRAKTYILEHLRDPNLDIAQIAEAQHIAPRTLNRLFAADGTTAIRWLWQQRLEASHKALSEGRIRQVTEAALSFGFNDFSHFSRSFKKVFGVQPNTFVRGGIDRSDRSRPATRQR